MRPMKHACIAVAVLCAAISGAFPSSTLMVVTAHGVWDAYPTEVAVNAGLFRDNDPAVQFLYSTGTGETMQAVISGSADIGDVGTLGALATYMKGAPIRIIGPESTGSAEYWYARTDSNIHSIKDTDGKTIAFSSEGSSTNSVVRAFIAEYRVAARGLATGSPAATLVAVMTGQVDAGWASPPFGFKEIDEGKIRIIARGNDLSSIRGQTIRVTIANVNSLNSKREELQRYMDRRARAIDMMYDDPRPLQQFADTNKMSEAMANRLREFYPRSMLRTDEIAGLDQLLQEAVELKYLPRPLTKDQLAEVIQLIKPRR
jgi:NitT/TauT family transport system substrate-binding protein